MKDYTIKVISESGLAPETKILDEDGKPIPGISGVELSIKAGPDEEWAAKLEVDGNIAIDIPAKTDLEALFVDYTKRLSATELSDLIARMWDAQQVLP